MKPVRVILSEDAKEVYKYLNSRASDSKIERSILRSVNGKIELIKMNTHYGDPVPKELIPNEYKIVRDNEPVSCRTIQFLENVVYLDK